MGHFWCSLLVPPARLTQSQGRRPSRSLQVKMSRKHIAQLIGRVFIQKSAVNLLSTVLDTPEFFWSAPDSMQSLYKVGWRAG